MARNFFNALGGWGASVDFFLPEDIKNLRDASVEGDTQAAIDSLVTYLMKLQPAERQKILRAGRKQPGEVGAFWKNLTVRLQTVYSSHVGKEEMVRRLAALLR